MCLDSLGSFLVLALILFLWVTGGIGWKGNFEARGGVDLSPWGAGIVYLLWPVFALYAGVGHTWESFKGREG